MLFLNGSADTKTSLLHVHRYFYGSAFFWCLVFTPSLCSRSSRPMYATLPSYLLQIQQPLACVFYWLSRWNLVHRLRNLDVAAIYNIIISSDRSCVFISRRDQEFLEDKACLTSMPRYTSLGPIKIPPSHPALGPRAAHCYCLSSWNLVGAYMNGIMHAWGVSNYFGNSRGQNDHEGAHRRLSVIPWDSRTCKTISGASQAAVFSLLSSPIPVSWSVMEILSVLFAFCVVWEGQEAGNYCPAGDRSGHKNT